MKKINPLALNARQRCCCSLRASFVLSRAFIVFSGSHFIIWLYAFSRGLWIVPTNEVVWWRRVSELLGEPGLSIQRLLSVISPTYLWSVGNSLLNGLVLTATVSVLVLPLSFLFRKRNEKNRDNRMRTNPSE